MAEKVPYDYMVTKIRKGIKYQHAVARWGQTAVEEVSIPYLIYLYTLLKKHGLLYLHRSKEDSIKQLELVCGVNDIPVPVVQEVQQMIAMPLVQIQKVGETVRELRHKVRRKLAARRRHRYGWRSVRHLLWK
jgi:hypothetical protein